MKKLSFLFIILFLFLVPVQEQQQPDTTFPGSAFTYPEEAVIVLVLNEQI
ncbi:MAG: hypothetical protein ROO71_03585 [Balneola sp.]